MSAELTEGLADLTISKTFETKEGRYTGQSIVSESAVALDDTNMFDMHLQAILVCPVRRSI